jgi:hypothetical protein
MTDYRPTVTARPDHGQCWVCHRRDTVPIEARDLIPAICGPECAEGWVATHVVTDTEWAPITPSVDLVVAEAGPPITPVTAEELAMLRRQQPAPLPVPGAGLRRFFTGVWSR